MSNKTVFRVHPTINFARFGTSDEFYLSPETSAGIPVPGTDQLGGLPLNAETGETISSADLRDEQGQLKRQAARFKLFAYRNEGEDCYPNGGGEEILPGTRLADGRVVKEIVWTVHLANKKAGAYIIVNSQGINAYADGKVPQLRNPEEYGTVDSPSRLLALNIDPGPRAIAGSEAAAVHFDQQTLASYVNEAGEIVQQPKYPQRFPADSYAELYEPTGPLNSLGELRTDQEGRLLVLASFGRTAAMYDEYGDPIPLTGDLNNVGWFDDAADGPVSATVIFEDAPAEQAFGAWVVCADPGYAPQIRNVVSVWDDVYNTWIRDLQLQPEIYGKYHKPDTPHDQHPLNYNPDYKPVFDRDIRPIFKAASLQRWTANLPELALRAHTAVESITGDDQPNETIMAGLNYIRNPNNQGESSVGVPLMPLSLGDAGKDFLSVSKTQYFFLEQWSKNLYDASEGPRLGPGELLDIASLSNCLGGRYVPGIELSYVVREKDIYITDWQTSGSGPFRVKPQPLDYATAQPDQPFLSGGWIPLHDMTQGLQPGDLSKFMAIPWQTDYNSCSIHQTSINTARDNTSTGNPSTLYWSWPSQRPDAVYVADEVVNNVLPQQKWSIRGPGTYAQDPKTASTFQKPLQAVEQWDRIGIILQGSAIDLADERFAPEFFLEVESQLDTAGISDDPVLQWPFNANPVLKKR